MKKKLFLWNSLGDKKEVFASIQNAKVKMYNCGPTVYGQQHIGNLSMFVFTDILKRTLIANEYNVTQVINITDVGHLTSDADNGDDKMMVGLKKENLTVSLENMKKLANKYANIFINDLNLLNINTNDIKFPRASDYINEQIEIIKTLQIKGFTYVKDSGVYFNTTKFINYGELGNIRSTKNKKGRTSKIDKESSSDFSLWKRSSDLGWDSPWGKGFPGWHIECTAMIFSILGKQIDIHTGGIEHLNIHHNNEICQAECASGLTPFSRFWLHRAHLQFDGEKISKSVGNVVYLQDIIDNNVDPIAFRYLLLGCHYRKNSNFTFELLKTSQKLIEKIYVFYNENSDENSLYEFDKKYLDLFMEYMNDDLNTPKALSVLWNTLNDNLLSNKIKVGTLIEFDKILGLKLKDNYLLNKSIFVNLKELDREMLELIRQRSEYKKDKNWIEADKIRIKIKEKGFEVVDNGTEVQIKKL